MSAFARWSVCGFVLAALVPWPVLLGAALVLGALAAGVYFGETADD